MSAIFFFQTASHGHHDNYYEYEGQRNQTKCDKLLSELTGKDLFMVMKKNNTAQCFFCKEHDRECNTCGFNMEEHREIFHNDYDFHHYSIRRIQTFSCVEARTKDAPPKYRYTLAPEVRLAAPLILTPYTMTILDDFTQKSFPNTKAPWTLSCGYFPVHRKKLGIWGHGIMLMEPCTQKQLDDYVDYIKQKYVKRTYRPLPPKRFRHEEKARK